MHVSMYLMDFVKTNRKVSVKVIVFHYFDIVFISHFPYCICWWFPWYEMRMAFCVYHKYIGHGSPDRYVYLEDGSKYRTGGS